MSPHRPSTFTRRDTDPSERPGTNLLELPSHDSQDKTLAHPPRTSRSCSHSIKVDATQVIGLTGFFATADSHELEAALFPTNRAHACSPSCLKPIGFLDSDDGHMASRRLIRRPGALSILTNRLVGLIEQILANPLRLCFFSQVGPHLLLPKEEPQVCVCASYQILSV